MYEKIKYLSAGDKAVVMEFPKKSMLKSEML